MILMITGFITAAILIIVAIWYAEKIWDQIQEEKKDDEESKGSK